MALRTLGVATATGAAQPVIGDVTTAITTAPVDGVYTTITVGSNVLYQIGDYIVLEPLTANADRYQVKQLSTITNGASTTQLQCLWEGGPGKAHASGVILQLAIPAMDVIALPVAAGSGPVVIGSDNTVALTPAGSALYRLELEAAGTQGNAWHMAGGVGSNVVNSADAWFIAAAGVKVFTYALVV